MAVDIRCWAQSLARWPLRTIQAPTPVTPGVSGGFVCQRGTRCDCCLGILTLRAVRAAAMALSWSQTRAVNPVWVRHTVCFLNASQVDVRSLCLGHYTVEVLSCLLFEFFSEIPANRLYAPCHYWRSPSRDCGIHTGHAIPLTHWLKRQTKFRNKHIHVFQVVSLGHKRA